MENMIQKLPKIPKGIMSPEGERYVGGLLENIQEKFDIIMEHLGFVEKRTNLMETRMDKVEVRLDEVELKLMDEE
jgi:tetrahydromethanopterin S-methyltransferase subunit G